MLLGAAGVADGARLMGAADAARWRISPKAGQVACPLCGDAGCSLDAGVGIGLGRIVALYYFPSTLHQNS